MSCIRCPSHRARSARRAVAHLSDASPRHCLLTVACLDHLDHLPCSGERGEDRELNLHDVSAERLVDLTYEEDVGVRRAAVSALGALGPAAGDYVDRLFSITDNKEDDEGIMRAAEQAIAQAAASGNLAAIEFVEGRGEYREMRHQLDELNAWYRKNEVLSGEMELRHEEERKCSTALQMNEPDNELAVLPPPSDRNSSCMS